MPIDETLYTDIRLDESGRIREEVSCRVCGYNLMGIDPHSICPECGTSAGWSLRGDLLKFSDPKWVKKLHNGTNMLAAALAAMILLICLAIGLASTEGWIGAAIASLLGILVNGLQIYGVWLLTTPESVEQYTGTSRIREIARWGMVIGLLLKATSTGMQANTHEISIMAGTILNIAGSLFSLVGVFAFGKHMANLAKRIPDQSLETQTNYLIALCIIFIGAAILLVIAAAISANSGNGIGAIGLFGCVGAIGYFAMFIWAVVLLFKYRNAFELASKWAEDSWAKEQVVRVEKESF